MNENQIHHETVVNRAGGGSTRIGYLDALKGFATLCVVLGHVAVGYLEGNTYPETNQILYGVKNVIYAFHMPLFMMISGCVYAVAYYRNGEPSQKRYTGRSETSSLFMSCSALFSV